MRAHDHVFTLRPLFDKGEFFILQSFDTVLSAFPCRFDCINCLSAGDYQVQLVASSYQAPRFSNGSAVPILNPAAPNFNVSRFSASVGNTHAQQQLLPPSSRAHMWHEISGKVVQQQQQRFN